MKLKIEQLINNRNNPASKQMVVTDRGIRTFFSYGSPICRKSIKRGTLTFGSKYRYSRTTMKHLLIYLRDYEGWNTHTIKDVDKSIKAKSVKYTEKW
jgi:hypothetical protein